MSIFESSSQKVKSCGKKTVLLRDIDTGDIYYSLYKCKDILCPSCSNVIFTSFKDKLAYYIYFYKMGYFFTMTTKSDLEELESVFSGLRKRSMRLNKDYYISELMSRPGKSLEDAEASYDRFISSVVDYELKCFYLFEYDGLKYKNYNNIAILLSERFLLPTFEEFSAFLHSVNISAYDKKKILGLFSSGVYAKKFIEMNSAERFSFFNELKPLFFALIDFGADDVAARMELIKAKLLKNIDTPFSYVRFLEYQKNGNGHYHILSNYNFPQMFFHQVWTDSTNIFKGVEIDSAGVEGLSGVADYVTKYITKDTLEEERKRASGASKRVSVVSSSHNIKLSLSYPKGENGKKMEFCKTLEGRVPPSSFGVVSGDIDIFEASLSRVGLSTRNDYVNAVQGLLMEYKDALSSYTGKNKGKDGFKEDFAKFKRSEWLKFLSLKNFQAYGFFKSEILKRVGRETFSIPFMEKIPPNASPEQIAFIRGLSGSGLVYALNGKAGTGKTTAVRYALQSLDFSSLRVGFVSFTGKASARLAEVAGVKGETIHRFCSARLNNLPDFANTEFNPVPFDVVFCDESTLLDFYTLSCFLNALPLSCKVVFIGDSNQLLPIGSNNAFAALCSFAETFTLSINYRSLEGVVKVANEVLTGDFSGISFLPYDKNKVAEFVSLGYQVLSNSNRLSREINEFCSSDGFPLGGHFYKKGQSVIVLRNSSVHGLFNGEIVTVVDCDSEFFYVEKDSVVYKYPLHEAFFSFAPSFSITVHKSQGSEYNKVCIVLDKKEFLLNNNLFYTAITRAKKDFVVFLVDGVDVDLLKVVQAPLYDGFDFGQDYPVYSPFDGFSYVG